MTRKNPIFEKLDGRFFCYSTANILVYKRRNSDPTLAIVIGKHKNKVLILTHMFNKKRRPKLVVEEVDYNEETFDNSDSKFEKEISFLTDNNFEPLYAIMSKKGYPTRYPEWFSIFTDDDFTPNLSTHYIVKNSMSNNELELWKPANKFFKDYPEAIIYGDMPNVDLQSQHISRQIYGELSHSLNESDEDIEKRNESLNMSPSSKILQSEDTKIQLGKNQSDDIKINQKPTTLFTYHYNKSNGVVLGSGEFPILKSSIKNGPVSFDLMKNCGNFAKRGHEDMVKSMWSSFVKSKPNDKPIDLRRDLGGADIVTWRGFLKNIGLLGLNDFNGGLHILAQKYNNVIFLEEYPKPNKDKEDKIKDQTSQMEDHKGHMFENFITENANGKSNENNNVDTSDVCNIVQTRIFTYNGKNTTVCYTAKVGALKHKGSEQFVEATTCIRNANKNLNDTLYKNKGKKYWMQSYLVGIEEIVVGIKKKGEKPVDAYFVEEIQVLKVDEIRQKNRINPQQAMDYIAKTLNEIKEQFNDPDTKFVEISKAKNNDEIKYKKLPGDYKSPLRGAFPLEFREAYPEKN